MDKKTQVQTLNEVVCISQNAIIFLKDTNPTIPYPAMSKIVG